MTDRELIARWWNEGWSEGLWAAAWGRSIEGLTAEQAAWSPPSRDGSAGRTSIWQIVLHMVFWRDNALRRMHTGKGPTEDEIAALNFPKISDVSERAWAEARARFKDTQDRVAAVFADAGADLSRVMYLVPHDCYHFGQVNYLRAMQGLRPIE